MLTDHAPVSQLCSLLDNLSDGDLEECIKNFLKKRNPLSGLQIWQMILLKYDTYPSLDAVDFTLGRLLDTGKLERFFEEGKDINTALRGETFYILSGYNI